MAYCRKCGALIDDYAAVCPKCGTPQNGGPNNPPPAADNGGFLWGLPVGASGLLYSHCRIDLVPGMEGYQAPDCQGGGHRRPGVRDRLCTDVRCGGGSGHQRSGVCLLSCGAGFGGGFRFSSDATAGRIALSIFGTERPFPSAPGAPGSWRATWWAVHPPAGVAAVLLVPLIADGLLQLCTPYESGNLRRLATGLLFGYGLTVLLLTSLGWAYQWGFGFGKTLLDP